MSKLPVTIIIPVYCAYPESVGWLEECVDSATRQNCYVICCDDGSPLLVEVADVLRKFPIDNTLLLEENCGVSHARNEAIRFASTDYIFPLDCDDYLIGNAVEQLYDICRENGDVPTYPDVSKFGDENTLHYELLDFDCEHITRYVGFSSVNVLHRKSQWEVVGGYDTSLKFYEDGEYNARLFGNFCGKRYPHPLVRYRIHENQRTKIFEGQSRQYAMSILERIRRYDMPCPGCSKRRTPNSVVGSSKVASMSAPSEKVTVNIGDAPAHLPIEMDGKVLCMYVGGQGRAKHYYQGLVTKQPFKVMHGDFVYADPRDARSKSDVSSRSFLIMVEKPQELPSKPLEVVKVAEVVVVNKQEIPVVEAPVVEEKPVERVARSVVSRTPVKKGKKR